MRRALAAIRDTAYLTSIELAREKAAFASFDRDAYLEGEYVRSLPSEIRDGIARHGIRNSHLIAIAPAGSISVLAGNVSSGIEPVYSARMRRRVLDPDGQFIEYRATSYSYELWRSRGNRGSELPPEFVTALELSAEAHLRMVAELQPLVDNSISKTVNVPLTIGRDEFGKIYNRAIELGLNGCTVFRSSPGAESILAPDESTSACCSAYREGD